jgi:hypothetical protein
MDTVAEWRDEERYPKLTKGAILATFYLALFSARAFLGATPLGNVPVILLCGAFILSTLFWTTKSAQLAALMWCLLLGVLGISVGIFRDGYEPSDVIGDLSTLIRGPIILLWVWMIAKQIRSPSLLNRLLKFCWAATSTMILFSAATGIGLNTYEYFKSGWKFFFVSNNELTFIYTFLTSFLVLQSGFRQSAIYLPICIIVLLVIGTKSGFVGLAILCFVLSLRITRRINRLLGFTYAMLINIAFFSILAFIDLEAILKSVLPLFSFSSGYEKVTERISYEGFWEGILSGRGRFVTFAVHEFLHRNDLIDYSLGMGFSDLKKSFGSDFGKESFIEVDAIDVLLSYGLLGVATYLSFIFYLVNRWLKELKAGSAQSEVYLFLGLSIFVVGNLSGHVIFNAWPMSTIGIVLGILEGSKAIRS